MFVLSVIEANGGTGPVHIIHTVTKRSNLPYIIDTIKNFNPKAFYSVEDIRFVSEAVFPENRSWWKSKFTALIGARIAK